MKFNPYAALLTTGVLMLAVVFAQTRSSVALLKAGAASVDRDVSSFAAKTLSSRDASQRHDAVVDDSRMSGTRVALTDRPLTDRQRQVSEE
jgi:hypothetical protein